MSTTNDGNGESFVITSHGVGDFDSWLAVFKENCERKEDNFHRNVLKAKVHIAGKTEDGKCLTFGIMPSSNDEMMKNIMKFDSPPFVGGPDLIKNGVIIPPFEPNLLSSMVLDRIDDADVSPEEDLVMYIASHGVPSFNDWFKGAFDLGEAGAAFLKELGIVHSWAGPGPVRASDGKETCVVVHLLKKSHIEIMKAFTKYDAPPFVGGPDLIKNGQVIPPFDINLYADVVYQYKY